jgi:hypothetical protein
MHHKSIEPNFNIERHISNSDNLVIGLGTYSNGNNGNNGNKRENKSVGQLLKFNKDYYNFASLTRLQNKLTYEWQNVKNANDEVLLEFEKSVPLNIIMYKFSKVHSRPDNNLVLSQGIFEPKYFTSIGMPITKEIDEILKL